MPDRTDDGKLRYCANSQADLLGRARCDGKTFLPFAQLPRANQFDHYRKNKKVDADLNDLAANSVGGSYRPDQL